MAVTPSGILSEPVASLRTTLSTMPAAWAFLTTTAIPVTDATSALTKLYAIGKPATATSGETAWARPFIQIHPPMQMTIGRGGFAAGRMGLYFERDVPSTGTDLRLTWADAHYDFSNLVGDVLRDLAIACEGDGTLIVQPLGIKTATDIQRCSLNEQDDYFMAGYWIGYGVRMEE